MRMYCCLVWIFAAAVFLGGSHASAQGVPTETVSRTSTYSNQPNSRQVEVANLRADIQILDRRLREMSMEMEEMMRQNRALVAELERQRKQNDQMDDVVRQAQLARVVNDLDSKSGQADSEMRRQIIREVSAQIEELGRQTQNAMDALARNVSSRPTPSAPRPSFSEDFPKEGVSYVVVSGDTLSAIAKRHNSAVRDIQNANQITNPAAIQVGQTLFIPQRQN